MKYRSNYQKIPNYKYKNGQFYTQEIQTQQLLWTEEMLLQGWCFSLITGFLRHTEIHIWRQGTKRTQRGSIQRNPVMGQETMGTSWNTGNAALAKPWRRQSQVVRGGWGVSSLEIFKSSLDMGRGYLALGVPAWAGAGAGGPRGRCQPHPVCGSVRMPVCDR